MIRCSTAITWRSSATAPEASRAFSARLLTVHRSELPTPPRRFPAAWAISPSFLGVGPPISPALDGTRVAFFGAGSSGQQGIYVSSAGPPIRIADTATAIPGGTGNFMSFGDVSLSDTDVAFLGAGISGQLGIYDLTGGSLLKVVDLTDIIDGRAITGLNLSNTGLFGDPIAFQATFADGSQGIYVIPEPCTLALLTLAGPILFGRTRRRSRRH